MKSYFKCNACGHQWAGGADFSTVPCPRCGNPEVDLEVGSVEPQWWRGPFLSFLARLRGK